MSVSRWSGLSFVGGGGRPRENVGGPDWGSRQIGGSRGSAMGAAGDSALKVLAPRLAPPGTPAGAEVLQ